jgi:hypothetical protein
MTATQSENGATLVVDRQALRTLAAVLEALRRLNRRLKEKRHGS